MDRLNRDEQEYIVRQRIGEEGVVFHQLKNKRSRFYVIDEHYGVPRIVDVTWLINSIMGVSENDVLAYTDDNLDLADTLNGCFGRRTAIAFRKVEE